MIVLAPLVIMPLFNKFDPIEDNLLKRDIEALATDCKYPVSNIEVVDGSKRSGHSNAFQYGFGKIKKIVVFDTLLDQHLGKLNDEKKDDKDKETKEDENDESSEDEKVDEKEEEKKEEKKTLDQGQFNYENAKGRLEILSIVAHELGHWAHMDILKSMFSSLTRIYLIFFAFSYSLKYTNMPRDFGFQDPSVYISLMLFFQLLEPIMEILSI